MLINILNFIIYGVLIYFIVMSFLYVLILIFSMKEIYLSFSIFEFGTKDPFYKNIQIPPVTVIIPTFNEEDMVFNSIDSILEATIYDNVFVIVVNDGSSDKTLEKLINRYDLYATHEITQKNIEVHGKVKNHYRSRRNLNILVIDKENGGKSDALNAGINACRTTLFITMDADTIAEPNAIQNLIWAMISKKMAIAVGGGVYALNGCTYRGGNIIKFGMSKNPICAIQICEYLRSFLFSRAGWNAFGGALCYSGTFTLFDHRSVIEIGGFDYKNVSQDFEIITHLQEHIKDKNIDASISYTPAAAVWTLIPETFSEFWHQRVNWQMGSLRSLLLHKKMFLNPKYGIVGLFTYPFFLLGEIGGGVVEFIAYFCGILSWFMGILDPVLVTMTLVLCWGFSAFLTFSTLLMNVITFNRYRNLTDISWIFLASLIEMCGFRQFNAVCRTYATIKYFFKRPVSGSA